VIHGRELAAPDRLDAPQRERLLAARVFARVSPEQKLNLITVTQASGRTVAMTGDGVNDAPALKKADIGVAMGRRGTDAARQVADMILQDDAFATIVAAVRQGRIIFGNIRKSVMFMLCTNVAEVLVVAAAAGLGGLVELPLPLRPLQILYLNVITDVFPAVALGVGPGEPGVMRRPPRPHDEPVLTRGHWRAVGGWAALLGACVLGALIIALHGLGLDQTRAVTVSFLTLAFGKLWFVYNLRDPGTRLLRNDIVANGWVAGAVVLCVVLLLLAVYLAPLRAVLKTGPPGAAGWLVLLGASLVPLLVGQTLRVMQRRRAAGAG
jgi:Ca2+-transporting ATPase